MAHVPISADTTTEALLTDATLQNKTIAIFAYHVLAPDQNYTAAELVPPDRKSVV